MKGYIKDEKEGETGNPWNNLDLFKSIYLDTHKVFNPHLYSKDGTYLTFFRTGLYRSINSNFILNKSADLYFSVSLSAAVTISVETHTTVAIIKTSEISQK